LGKHRNFGRECHCTSDAIHNASLIEKVTEQLVDGEIVLIALEQETEDGTVQKMLSKFDVSIIEEDAAEVVEEVERAPDGDKVKTLPICEFFENLIKPIAFGSGIAYYISELGRNSLRPSLMKKPSVRRR
jgi:hypothetical protein